MKKLLAVGCLLLSSCTNTTKKETELAEKEKRLLAKEKQLIEKEAKQVTELLEKEKQLLTKENQALRDSIKSLPVQKEKPKPKTQHSEVPTYQPPQPTFEETVQAIQEHKDEPQIIEGLKKALLDKQIKDGSNSWIFASLSEFEEFRITKVVGANPFVYLNITTIVHDYQNASKRYIINLTLQSQIGMNNFNVTYSSIKRM